MRLFALIISFVLFSCGDSENLDDDELEYVNIAVALGRIKASAKDSTDHARLRDSIYRVFNMTNDAFAARTEAMTDHPQRTSLIFRAIGDSLGVR